MFNMFALLLDDALKRATPLIAPLLMIAQWRRRLECVVQQQGGYIEHAFDVRTATLYSLSK